jgi:hypothetical protein
MPFTPFHLGPGLVVKVVAPSYFSFPIFVFSQVLMDFEPLFYMFRGEWPIHRFFHTYPGATLIVMASFVVGRPLCGFCLAVFQRSFRLTISGLSEAMRLINPIAALSASIIGSYSHVALDSIMHSDIRPLAPFADDNILLNSITVLELHLYCVFTAIVGAIGMGFWWLVWRERG